MKLPAGPGAPAPDAVEALTEATAACRGIRTLTAEVAASGKVDGQRFRVRLSAGVAAPGSARVEAVAPFGPPIFILVADNDDATTLLLPRDDRVLRQGRSAEVLDAVAGVPMSAADLRLVLTGCASQIPHPEGVALGADWRMIDEGRGAALVPAPRRQRAAVAARCRHPAAVARRVPRSPEWAAAIDAHHERDGLNKAPDRST